MQILDNIMRNDKRNQLTAFYERLSIVMYIILLNLKGYVRFCCNCYLVIFVVRPIVVAAHVVLIQRKEPFLS